MKLVFYSTNSNYYSENTFIYKNLPVYEDLWKEFKNKHPEDEFIIVTQKPGIFLADSSSLTPHYLPDNLTIDEIVAEILSHKPDKAIACTYWTQPYDWLTINDAIIAEKLRENGVDAICHTPQASMLCFNKLTTHNFLVQNNFNCAKAVYVHHELFYAERNRNNVKTNVYKEYVYNEIKKLKFPVVIKDTGGLSSYGMDVVKTFNEAVHVLTSKKNNGDKLVEEFLEGPSFGIEVYGRPGNYFVSEVLINSVNQFGLTSPKQNVKLGPVMSEEFKIDELKREILRMADLLEVNGIMQVDLLFSEGRWYIIEINSRISGMTQTICAGMGISIYDLFYEIAACSPDRKICFPHSTFVMNLKFPLLSESDLQKLKALGFVFYVNQIENKEAKQLREVGYAEAVFGGTKKLPELMEQLDIINKNFPQIMEPVFYTNAYKLYKTICP